MQELKRLCFVIVFNVKHLTAQTHETPTKIYVKIKESAWIL